MMTKMGIAMAEAGDRVDVGESQLRMRGRAKSARKSRRRMTEEVLNPRRIRLLSRSSGAQKSPPAPPRSFPNILQRQPRPYRVKDSAICRMENIGFLTVATVTHWSIALYSRVCILVFGVTVHPVEIFQEFCWKVVVLKLRSWLRGWDPKEYFTAVVSFGGLSTLIF